MISIVTATGLITFQNCDERMSEGVMNYVVKPWIDCCRYKRMRKKRRREREKKNESNNTTTTIR